MTGIRHRTIQTHGIQMHLAEAGEGPLVLLCHGFPELWYSWRHQLVALAAAGFHAVAPDMRGYGRTDAPERVDAYSIFHLVGDMVGVLDACGVEQAVIVGHDWGSLVAWNAALFRPDRFRAVVGMSVPFMPRGPLAPTRLMKAMAGDRFFYILYFQQVGPPEAELAADTRDTMAKVLYGASGVATAGREMPTELPPMEGTGFLTMMSEPPALPYTGPEGPWLTADDLDMYAAEFAHSGFFGPVSWYRNLDANAERGAGLGADRLTMPSYFITGESDVVRLMDPTGPERMRNLLPDYRGETIIPGAGHWVQQETPQAFNDALLGFLRSL